MTTPSAATCWVCLWPCDQWQSCSLIFGVEEHLVQHLVRDHTNPSQETVKCRWRGCNTFFANQRSVRQVTDPTFSSSQTWYSEAVSTGKKRVLKWNPLCFLLQELPEHMQSHVENDSQAQCWRHLRLFVSAFSIFRLFYLTVEDLNVVFFQPWSWSKASCTL